MSDSRAGEGERDAYGFTPGMRATIYKARGDMRDDYVTPMERAYFDALDEIWRLRQALAWEAGAIEADIGMKSFPKSRRQIAAERIDRLRAAARGESERAYAGVSSIFLRNAMQRAGASETFTRHQWEVERGIR